MYKIVSSRITLSRARCAKAETDFIADQKWSFKHELTVRLSNNVDFKSICLNCFPADSQLMNGRSWQTIFSRIHFAKMKGVY